MGEPDSSSDISSPDENCNDERIKCSKEEIEQYVQPENEGMDTHEVAEQPQLQRKPIFKNLNKVLNKSNYEELPAQKQ